MIKEFFDNWFEIGYGFAYGLLSCFFLGWYGLLVAVWSSVLWRLGGMRGHAIRVFGCPLLIFLPIIILTEKMFLGSFCYGLSSGVVSEGYSVPDVNHTKASWLGTFFYKKFKGNRTLTDLATRGTLFLLLALILLLLHF